MSKLFFLFALGAFLWFIPVPHGLTPQAWHLFSIFVPTIVGLITKPLPLGGVAILSLAIASITQTIDLAKDGLVGFGSPIVWMIVMVFFMARGWIKTRLGERLGYYFIALFGKSTLGLGYSFLLTELLIGPLIPSNTARAGGILYPILRSIAQGLDSHGHNEQSAKRIGHFLTSVCYHGNLIVSAMFLTGMATNPLIQLMAAKQGVTITWGNWALGALVPGLLSLIIVPLVIYWMEPPQLRYLPEAVRMAKEKLQELGPMKKPEILMSMTFGVMVALWIVGDSIGISAVLTAFLGVSTLLILNIITWDDMVKEHEAWHLLVWMSILITLSSCLEKFGFVQWISAQMFIFIQGFSWQKALLIISVSYFYSHYLFAGNTSHVSAMYSAILAVAIATGAPGLVAALILGYFSNIFSCLTHYGSASAGILYGSGYVSAGSWMKMGFVISVVYMILWLGVGSFWYKFLGMF
jgi:DASS family divalent anion:Na+ symporter